MLIFILILVLALVLWVEGWKQYYRARFECEEVHFLKSKGPSRGQWSLAVSRFRPRGGESRKFPIILQHGLGSNRFNFGSNSSGKSLPTFLANCGFDVYVPELRGHGLSEHPNFFGDKNFGWGFDEHLEEDVPAIIEKVLEVSGSEKVHYLGFSMGGMLLYSYLSQNPNAPIASGVALASSLSFSGTPSDFHSMSRFNGLLKFFSVAPNGLLKKALAPFAGRGTRLDRFYANPENMEAEDFRKLYANAFESISTGVLSQLKTALEPKGLLSKNRNPFSEKLAEVKTPILAICGDKDLQCAPQAAKTTLELVSGERRFVEMGPDSGRKRSYGHMDLVLGNRAEEEVFPELLSWFERFDQADVLVPKEGDSGLSENPSVQN